MYLILSLPRRFFNSISREVYWPTLKWALCFILVLSKIGAVYDELVT